MIADSERREVARRLRELDYADLQECLICAYLDALGIEGYADWVGIARRLADLIELSCDREALLALAEKLDGLGLNGFSSGWSNGAVNVGSFARRIRKALGVSNDE